MIMETGSDAQTEKPFQLDVAKVEKKVSNPGWAESERREIILAFAGLVSNGNWSWLGNFSDVREHEALQRLLGYMGFRYCEDEPFEKTDASTAITLEPRKDVGRVIENLFSVGRNEIFEDGTESYFSKELVSLVRRHGELTILEIARIITTENADGAVAAEALKWIGRIDHAGTHSFRRWLLLRGLNSSNPLVREGAGLGLSFMNDPAAMPLLKQAIEREQIVELRDDLNQVLQQLQQSH